MHYPFHSWFMAAVSFIFHSPILSILKWSVIHIKISLYCKLIIPQSFYCYMEIHIVMQAHCVRFSKTIGMLQYCVKWKEYHTCVHCTTQQTICLRHYMELIQTFTCSTDSHNINCGISILKNIAKFILWVILTSVHSERHVAHNYVFRFFITSVYRQTSNINCTLDGNTIVEPVGAATTTSSFST